MEIKYVSYDAPRYSRCMGVLTLEIDGERKTFGLDGCDYPAFWTTGGRVWFDKDWGEHVERGEWLFDPPTGFPKKFVKESATLVDIMNENVAWGCCGGCV